MNAAARAFAEVRCARCRHVLGMSDGQWLILGMALVRRATLLTCVICGTKHLWKPDYSAQPLDKSEDP